mgnify:CR=1 FL=1
MNNNDKEFEEIKAWRHCEELRKREIGWTITLSSLEEENEKLKEEVTSLNSRFLEDTHFKVVRSECIKLKEENAKLKGLVFALRGHMEISSWTNKEQRLAQMNLELEEENEKLKEELQTFKDRWIGT